MSDTHVTHLDPNIEISPENDGSEIYNGFNSEENTAESFLEKKDFKDDRVGVDFDKLVPGYVEGVGQIRSSIYKSQSSGTGLVRTFVRDDRRSVSFLQTCAHNFLGEKSAGVFPQARSAAFSLHRISNEILMAYRIVAYFVPP